jgi:hypothetical protein
MNGIRSSEADLALCVVQAQINGGAVGHDHPFGLLAGQRLRGVAITTRGDLKQCHLLALGDRQPLAFAGLRPARLIRTADRFLTERLEDLQVRVLQRDRALLKRPLERCHADGQPEQVAEHADRLTRPGPRGAQARRGRLDAPAGIPSGSCASMHVPQSQRTRIRRCSVTSTRTITSET